MGKVFNLVIWQIQYYRSPIKNSPIELNACASMAVALRLLNLNFANANGDPSPNLVLAEVTRYPLRTDAQKMNM